MDIMTDAQMLDRIETFLAKNKIPPSRFGREVMGDPALVFQLRDQKRSLSLKNAEKIVLFMEGYQPPASAEAA